MSKNLIITSGNSKFFGDLKRFVNSLRAAGEYDDQIVICDNLISGKWNQPGTYLDEDGFKSDQKRYLEDRGAEIIKFSDLVARNGVSRRDIESMGGRTQRYPYKIIYNCLISKEYQNKVNNICYLDSDVLFQKSAQVIFDSIVSEEIYMTSEHDSIGDLRFMKEWIGTTDVSFGSQNSQFLKEMYLSSNMCTGFIGGTSKSFNRFMQMCWIFASSNVIEFHTDQPLVNIIKSYYGYPVTELGKDTVLHLKGTPEDKLTIEGSTILYDGVAPAAVHFNGASDVFKDGVIDPEYKPSRSKRSKVRSLLSKAKAIIKKS